MDDAHLAKEKPIWKPGYWSKEPSDETAEWINGYWVCPYSNSNLTETAIEEKIDAGTWTYYCNTDDLFWIEQQHGPHKPVYCYGPFQGNLWKLANIINPIALTGTILSTTSLLYLPIRRYLIKTRTLDHTQQRHRMTL